MTSILDTLTGLLGSRDVISKIGSLAGTDERETSSLLGQAGPAILGGLADKAAEPGGAGALFDAVRGADAGAADNPLGFLGGLGGAADTGLLSRLLPNLGGGSLGKVSALVLPLVLGLLKKRVSTEGLDAGGLGALLSREKAGLPRDADGRIGGLAAGAAAGGLAGAAATRAGDIAGATGDRVRDLGGNVRDTAGRVGDAARDKGTAAASAARGGAGRVATDVETRRGGGFLKWLVPLALVGALAFGGWWFMNRDGDVDMAATDGVGANVDVDAPDVDAPDVDAPDVDAPDVDVDGAVDAAGDAASDAAEGAGDAANAAGDAAEDAADGTADAVDGTDTDADTDAGADAADDAEADTDAGAGADADAPASSLPATGR